MCEPHHSINQFDDEDGPRTGMLKGAIQSTPKSWMKRIWDWLHFSRMGAGHSEAMRASGFTREYIAPDMTRYEVSWWDRSIKRDGTYYSSRRSEYNEALSAAEKYAHSVSIGDLQMLRRFLEDSLSLSPNPEMYVHYFRKMLNKEGIKEMEAKCMFISGGKNSSAQSVMSRLASVNRLSPEGLVLIKAATKMVCGLTRKRALLVPEWADDDTLWVPPNFERSLVLGDAISYTTPIVMGTT